MNKKRKLNIKKIIIFLLVLCLFLYLVVKDIFHHIEISSNYEVTSEEKNPNYSGIGQQKISGQDGYFTTFTTNR